MQHNFFGLESGMFRDIEHALMERGKLRLADRRQVPAPQVTRASWRPALFWVVRVLHQDEPVLLWTGGLATVSYLAYLLCVGAIRLIA